MLNLHIEPASAQRLLRDLEASFGITVKRVVADAQDHLWLLRAIRVVDVAGDVEFQRRLCRHAGMRGKLRMRRESLFTIVDEIRRQEARNYPDILIKVSELTGQVEKSVASEILALLEGDQPTIDREVRELLPRYGFHPLPESPLFDECVAYHRTLREWLLTIIEMPGFRRLEGAFDGQLGPDASLLSPLRKLNLILSNSYRTVALMPNLDGVRRTNPRKTDGASTAATADASADSTASSSTSKPGVRLHLCR